MPGFSHHVYVDFFLLDFFEVLTLLACVYYATMQLHLAWYYDMLLLYASVSVLVIYFSFEWVLCSRTVASLPLRPVAASSDATMT